MDLKTILIWFCLCLVLKCGGSDVLILAQFLTCEPLQGRVNGDRTTLSRASELNRDVDAVFAEIKYWQTAKAGIRCFPFCIGYS